MRKSTGNFRYLCCSVLGLACCPIMAYANQHTDKADVSRLGVMTVQEQYRAATVTVIDIERGDIEKKHSASAYDVLENQPGLNVVRRLGLTGSGLSRLSIRGNGNVGPAGIQILVDGRPDATVSFAHPTPSALSLQDVERIEIIHGPSPVLHGSGKTGVVNISTGEPTPGLHGYLEGSYGSFDTTENFGGLSYGGDRAYFRVSGSYRSSDGDNPSSRALVKSINAKAGYQFNNIFSVTAGIGRNADSFEVFETFFVPGPFTDPRIKSLDLVQTVFDLTLNADFDKVQSSLKVYHDDLEPVSQVLDAPEKRANVFERGLRFKTSWAATDDTKLTAGVDYLRAQADNSPVLPPFTLPGTTIPHPRLAIPRARVSESLNELGIYGFIEQNLSRHVSVSGGLRYTRHSAFDSATSGELGLTWTPVPDNVDNLLYGTTFRARATRGFQAPTLQQLFGVFRGGRNGPANPNLDEEVLKQYEIGVNKSFTKGNLDIVVYVQDGEGIIETPAAPPPPPPDIQNNIDFANRGIEARLHFYPTANWETMLGISVADFENNNTRFLRVPEKTLDFGITYKHSFIRPHDFSINLAGRFARDTTDVPVNTTTQVKLDNYFLADLKANYHINKQVKTFFQIDNITDEEFELVSGIPVNGLGISAGLRLEY